ncbi:MAG TPA: PAS domain-containing protein, partial [Chloroflexota bacterium]|nr:PAS domain-containing protein [Chloroflexota bacterium]
MALVMIVILISWVVAGVFMARGLSDQVDALQGERVMGVGRLLASRSDVRDAFQLEHPESVLQPLVEQLLKESNLDLIVVMDMRGIRYAHPNRDLVGLPFTGGDEGAALRGEEYVSHALGISGPSLRAFVPLHDRSGGQIGVVVAGVWTQNVENQTRGLLSDLAAFSLVGLVAGAFGAAAVAYNIKASIFGLEPAQIGTMLEERLAILQGVREGVMAVDREGRITLLNSEAERLLGIGEDVIGLPVVAVVPNSRLPEVVASGEPAFDQEQT